VDVDKAWQNRKAAPIDLDRIGVIGWPRRADRGDRVPFDRPGRSRLRPRAGHSEIARPSSSTRTIGVPALQWRGGSCRARRPGAPGSLFTPFVIGNLVQGLQFIIISGGALTNSSKQPTCTPPRSCCETRALPMSATCAWRQAATHRRRTARHLEGSRSLRQRADLCVSEPISASASRSLRQRAGTRRATARRWRLHRAQRAGGDPGAIRPRHRRGRASEIR